MNAMLRKLGVAIAVAGSCAASTAFANGVVDLWAMSNSGDGNLWTIDVGANTTTLIGALAAVRDIALAESMETDPTRYLRISRLLELPLETNDNEA